jgi:hypothetical protein
MTKLLSFSILIVLAGGCSKKKGDPNAQCEQIFQKGDGSKPYATDKQAFIAACLKVGAQTRTCLLSSDMMKDENCAPGKGSAFREAMQLMQLGQGGGKPAASTPSPPAAGAFGEISTVSEKGAAPIKFTPKLGVASQTSSPASWQIYLVDDCASLPANPCDLLPKNFFQLDGSKLAGCAGLKSVKISLTNEDQMKPVDLKPGKFGKATADAPGAYLSYYHDVGQSTVSVTNADNLVEVTAVDADKIAGTLTAKNGFGQEITGGPFTATVCK